MTADRRLLWLTLAAVVAAHLGAHVDAWSHVHAGFALESFWTWPHALLYAGKAATATVVGVYWLRRRTLPVGYAWVLLGVGLFLAGGVADLGWHRWVGVEARLETLVSPPHLWLVVAGLVSTFGLLRAAVAGQAVVPIVVSLAIAFRLTTWSAFYSDPLAVDYAAAGARVRDLPAFAGMAWETMTAEIAGLTGLMLQSVLAALFVVVPLRAMRLPAGAIAGILLWNGGLAVALTDLWRHLPAVVGAALVGEVVAAWVRAGNPDASPRYWLLGAAIPATQVALTVGLGDGVRWTPHLAAGAPVVAGLYGLIASVLVVPPRWLRAP